MTSQTVIDRASENATEIRQVVEAVEDSEVELLVREIDAHSRIIFLASGRSLLMLKAIAMRLMHLGLDAHVAGDVVTPALRTGDLLVVASARLGESARIAIGKAKAIGADVFVLTTDRGAATPLAASNLLEIPVRTSVQTVQHAGSLFEQSVLVLGDAVCRSLQAQRDVPTAHMDARHANL